MQQLIYPPTCEDPIREAEFFEKHQEAFKRALQDASLPVRLQAIEQVLCQLAFWFDTFPQLLKTQIRDILGKLVVDANADTRAMVFKVGKTTILTFFSLQGFRFFASDVSSKAKAFAVSTLKSFCPNGIDDSSEKVRLNVFRLLNTFQSSDVAVSRLFLHKVAPLELRRIPGTL